MTKRTYTWRKILISCESANLSLNDTNEWIQMYLPGPYEVVAVESPGEKWTYDLKFKNDQERIIWLLKNT